MATCSNCDGSGRVMRLGGPNSSGGCWECAGTGRVQRRTSTPKPASNRGFSVSDELLKLARLHAAGALTDEEFRLAKKKILGN